MKKFFFIGLTGAILFACQDKKQETGANDFRDKWINSCTKVIVDSCGVDMDGAYVREKVSCLYDAIYAIDSTYLQMKDGYKANDWINKHSAELDSLCDMGELSEMMDNKRKAPSK
jgi:hypothetical protein